MTRVLIPLAIVGCIVALWLMQSEPETKAVQGNSTVRDTTAETNSTPVERRLAVDRVTKSKKVDVEHPRAQNLRVYGVITKGRLVVLSGQDTLSVARLRAPRPRLLMW